MTKQFESWFPFNPVTFPSLPLVSFCHCIYRLFTQGIELGTSGEHIFSCPFPIHMHTPTSIVNYLASPHFTLGNFFFSCVQKRHQNMIIKAINQSQCLNKEHHLVIWNFVIRSWRWEMYLVEYYINNLLFLNSVILQLYFSCPKTACSAE